MPDDRADDREDHREDDRLVDHSIIFTKLQSCNLNEQIALRKE
jgi:hypothetical protein